MSIGNSHQDLLRYRCMELPEYVAFAGQAWRRQRLIEQTGGGERFIDEAGPLLRKHVLQSLRYGSASSRFVHQLRNTGISDEVLARALARAWLGEQDHFELPKPRRRELLRATPALALYSVLIMIGLLVAVLAHLREARPLWAETLLAFPPLLALVGAAGAVPIFALLRALVPRRRASTEPSS